MRSQFLPFLQWDFFVNVEKSHSFGVRSSWKKKTLVSHYLSDKSEHRYLLERKKVNIHNSKMLFFTHFYCFLANIARVLTKSHFISKKFDLLNLISKMTKFVVIHINLLIYYSVIACRFPERASNIPVCSAWWDLAMSSSCCLWFSKSICTPSNTVRWRFACGAAWISLRFLFEDSCAFQGNELNMAKALVGAASFTLTDI